MASEPKPVGDADPAPPRWFERFPILRTGPLRLGFLATIGVLLALVLGGAVAQLASVLTLLFLAVFISMGLYPVVTALRRRRVPKPLAILIVVGAFAAFLAIVLLLVVPIAVGQGGELLRALPGQLAGLESQAWFVDLNSRFNDYPQVLLAWLRTAAADPNTWVAIGGGALGIVANVINGTFSAIFVVAVTLYFVAGLERMKASLYELVPASKVAGFREITEEIVESIGKYLGGQVVLAAITGALAFLVMTFAGLQYVAAPVAASLLLVVKKVIVPHQRLQ